MRKVVLKILWYLPLFLLPILLCLLMRSSFAYMNERTDYFIPDIVSNIIFTSANIVLYRFLLNNAVKYDVVKDETANDSNAFLSLFKNPGFYTSTLLLILYDLLFSSSASNRLAEVLKNKPLSVLISAALIIGLSILVWVSNIKNNIGNKEKKKSRPLSIILGYVIPSAAVVTIVYFIPFIAVQINVILFFGRFVLIGLIAALLIYFTVIYSKALTERKKFLIKLKEICKEKGYVLSEIRNPYKSIFRDDGKINYTVKNKDTITEHKLAACINRSTNVLFFDGGGIIKDLPVKLGKNNILFSFRNRLDIKSEKCYVIYTSPPNNALDGTSNGKALIDNGMTVGTLTYYTSTGYLNDLERGLIK